MADKNATHDYTGVFFGPPRETVQLRAKSDAGAKTQMRSKFGPEFEKGKENGAPRWRVGRSAITAKV